MYQASIARISAEQNRDMREQAVAWRRAQEARGVMRPSSPFARISRNTRSLARQRRQNPAQA
jgi:hypothetical protein